MRIRCSCCCRCYAFGCKCQVVAIRGVSDGSRLAIYLITLSLARVLALPTLCCARAGVCAMHPFLFYITGLLRVCVFYLSFLVFVLIIIFFYLISFHFALFLFSCSLKKLNAPRPSEHPLVRGENAKTFRLYRVWMVEA